MFYIACLENPGLSKSMIKKNNPFLYLVTCILLIPQVIHAQNLFSPSLLQDKVAIVTGGASGIGGTIVKSFAQHGAIVVFVDINKERGTQLSRELSNISKPHLFVHGDLSKDETCKQAVQAALMYFDRIDILINNAALNDQVGLKASPAAFKKSIEINLIHYFTMLHYAVDALKKSNGTIINISSKVALTGQGGTSGYAASKGAILALTREWAVELAPYGVRVNAVIPAEVLTDAYKKWIASFSNHEQKLQRIIEKIPLGQRMTTAQEITDTVLFLASPLASHTTGQFLSVDGGYVHLDRAITILNEKND